MERNSLLIASLDCFFFFFWKGGAAARLLLKPAVGTWKLQIPTTTKKKRIKESATGGRWKNWTPIYHKVFPLSEAGVAGN